MAVKNKTLVVFQAPRCQTTLEIERLTPVYRYVQGLKFKY